MPQRKFIIVMGAQKAGTTWVYSMLRQNRQVSFAFSKEVHYFDRIARRHFDDEKALRTLRRNLEGRGALTRLRHFFSHRLAVQHEAVFSDVWYEELFSRRPGNIIKEKLFGPQVYCDISPSYMSMGDDGYEHMARLFPNLKPVLIVRDPVKRMISGMSMWLARDSRRQELPEEDLVDVLRNQQEKRGDYGRAIPLLRRYFDNPRIVEFGRISTDPVGVLREIETDAGIGHARYRRTAFKKNSHSGQIELSPQTIGEIKRICEPQYEYLSREFGAEFLARI